MKVLEDPYVWAEKYNLKVKDCICKNCGNSFLATVPVADKGMRGLQIPDHGCPSEYNYQYYMIIDEELKQELLNGIRSL